MHRVGVFLILSLFAGPMQDAAAILKKGDALFEEAKAAYEAARSKSSVPAFVEAGFKLEEARIKFIVSQEIGSPEQPKTAVDRSRNVNQLVKLINEGRLAISGTPAPGADVKPADPNPPPTAPPAPPSDPKVLASAPLRAPVPEP